MAAVTHSVILASSVEAHRTLIHTGRIKKELWVVAAEALVFVRPGAAMAEFVALLAASGWVRVLGQAALMGQDAMSTSISIPGSVTAEAGSRFVARARQTRPVTIPAFIDGLIVVGAERTLRETFSVVANSLWVTTHTAVVKVRSVTGGTVSMAAQTLLLLITGEEAIRTIIHAASIMEEEELCTLLTQAFMAAFGAVLRTVMAHSVAGVIADWTVVFAGVVQQEVLCVTAQTVSGTFLTGRAFRSTRLTLISFGKTSWTSNKTLSIMQVKFGATTLAVCGVLTGDAALHAVLTQA